MSEAPDRREQIAQQVERAAMPAPGWLPGVPHLNPKLAPHVPSGAPRPLAPGEYVRNPDGGWSSEESLTVAHPNLNDGKPTNIPSLWIVDGKPYRAKNEDEAAALAAKSGLSWPTYGSIEEADKAAADRETKWQGMAPEQASTVPPLYVPQTPAPAVAPPQPAGIAPIQPLPPVVPPLAR